MNEKNFPAKFLYLADMNNSDDSKGNPVLREMEELSHKMASRQMCHLAIANITKILLMKVFQETPQIPVILAPIMRSGVSMLPTAQEFFNFPEVMFMSGERKDGKTTVTIQKRLVTEGKHVVILDPIIATGNTAIKAYKSLNDKTSTNVSCTMISCYASPEGVTNIQRTITADLFVGCLALTVDNAGYLMPSTNGDMGDKLFGIEKPNGE
ncbi:MAG: uracil phosphoribosyltransferase [Candidatus Saccharimonadales bacterium]